MQESSIGGVRSVQILSSGQGYETIPPVSVANTEIASYGNAPEKVGANSIPQGSFIFSFGISLTSSRPSSSP